jgi:hypothetical protein
MRALTERIAKRSVSAFSCAHPKHSVGAFIIHHNPLFQTSDEEDILEKRDNKISAFVRELLKLTEHFAIFKEQRDMSLFSFAPYNELIKNKRE